LPGARFSAPANLRSTTFPDESSKSTRTAYDALSSVLLVMVTRTADNPLVTSLGKPLMLTSDTALPRPCTFSSAFSAAALVRAAAASTDASNCEARADAEEAAAEAEARAEAIAEPASEASAEGGKPENDAAFGLLGAGVGEDPPPPPPSSHPVTAVADRAQPSAASTARRQ
jgi:hypothetical protein